MEKVIKLHQWLGDKLRYREMNTKRLAHYHRLRIWEAEIKGQEIKDRKCPERA